MTLTHVEWAAIGTHTTVVIRSRPEFDAGIQDAGYQSVIAVSVSTKHGLTDLRCFERRR